MQQEFALIFITEFIQDSKKTLLTFEEKTFSRQMARSFEDGSDVYKFHSLMHDPILERKEFEGVVRRLSQAGATAKPSKVIDSACKGYHQKLMNDSTRKLETPRPSLEQHFSSRDIAKEPSDANQTLLFSPNTTATSFSPPHPNTRDTEQTRPQASVSPDVLATDIRSHFYTKFGSSANELIQSSALLNSPLFGKNEYSQSISEALVAFQDNKARVCAKLFSSPERPKAGHSKTPERTKETAIEPVSTGRRCGSTKQSKQIASSIPAMLTFSRSDLNQNFPQEGSALIAASFWSIGSQSLLPQTKPTKTGHNPGL